MHRIALVGVGNCSCALVQALNALAAGHIRHSNLIAEVSDVPPASVAIVAAFDVDSRKVGLPVDEAIFAEPNCTSHYFDVPAGLPVVSPGPVADGVDGPLADVVKIHPDAERATAADVAAQLRACSAQTMLLYLPVGAQRAAELYAQAAAEAGCSLINCTPVTLGRAASWRERFASRKLLLLGDDIKSHLGSTTVHQALLALLADRGITVSSTYQLNIGGNTDFLNMRDIERSAAKRRTKATALYGYTPPECAVSLGPSDHIPQLRDRKVAYIRIEGSGYLGMPLSMELRLDVEDSPNAAAVAIDALRVVAAVRSGITVDLSAAMRALFKAPANGPG